MPVVVDAASAASDALAASLHQRPEVLGFFVLPEERAWHVWVLLARWDRSTRFAIYEAHRQADPHRWLALVPTDEPAEIPGEAKAVWVRQ